MGTMVEATLPAEGFALADLFDRTPDAGVETLPVVAPNDGNVMPLLWVGASDLEAAHAGLEGDESTAAVRHLTRTGERCLYWVEWCPRVRDVVSTLGHRGGSVLGVRATSGRWRFRLLFPAHEAVSETYEHCQARGIDLSVRRVTEVTDPGNRHRCGLSEKQSKTLTEAFETGYYGIPRGTTLEELADSAGVSHQALSERLRRGYRTLISNALCDGAEGAP